MAQLVIHSGNFKTGSTSIQHFFFHNKTNFHYPRIKNHKTFYHCQLVLEYIRNKPEEWDGNPLISKYINEINDQDGDVLLSAENLVRMKSSINGELALRHLINNTKKFDHEVVFYYREPLSFLKSWYNQQNKQAVTGNSTRNFLNFFKSLEVSFMSQYDIYEFFVNVFGEGKVKVIEYGLLKGDSHLNNFMNVIGCNVKISNSPQVNEGIPKGQLELVRLSKFHGSIERATFTDADFFDIKKKIDDINRVFSSFGESCLNVFSLLMAHWDLICDLKPLFKKDFKIYKEASDFYKPLDSEKSARLLDISNLLYNTKTY